GVRVPMPAFVLIVHPRGDDAPVAGYGITATKKLGGAVIRNRVKRRFRSVVRDVFPHHALMGADHILIGRADALTMPHDRLVADIAKALGKAQRRLDDRREGRAPPTAQPPWPAKRAGERNGEPAGERRGKATSA
ncbi:MAG: ribonuclease P protein component, partial [Sphingopyxis sp.]